MVVLQPTGSRRLSTVLSRRTYTCTTEERPFRHPTSTTARHLHKQAKGGAAAPLAGSVATAEQAATSHNKNKKEVRSKQGRTVDCQRSTQGSEGGSRGRAGLEEGGWWRVFEVKVGAAEDPGKDSYGVSAALCRATSRQLRTRQPLPAEALTIVRKSFDARRADRLCFVYVVDVDARAAARAGARHRQPRPGNPERIMPAERGQVDSSGTAGRQAGTKEPVVVVGSGPAGLFAALCLAEAGVKVVLLERGQPVEGRGRDIGALFVRRRLNPESNLCYGEGGAGTWSDGKLTTRIGRNSDDVRRVLQRLHDFGAPASILVAGKPHLGTDRLVRLLRAFRRHLIALGVDVRFGTRVTDLAAAAGRVTGVVLADGELLKASHVVLAVGHSSRLLYERLLDKGVALTPKSFAMGFRIEHPQALIDRLQYGEAAAQQVLRGAGPLPVADYRLAATLQPEPSTSERDSAEQQQEWEGGAEVSGRSIFSFCMCPGGQVVPTSTTADELCVNGMSFSRRNSAWANSALVVGVIPQDWRHLQPRHGPLAGMALQKRAEREAAVRGGGSFVAPVQRVTDFLAGHTSAGQLPSSSYRLGVRSAPLHDLYDGALTAALRQALLRFERQLPGFLCEDGLLHGVETRTSAPVTIERGQDFQSVSMGGLYPTGEGAGYAGGIVSAAVDGLKVGTAILQQLQIELKSS